MTKTLIAAVFGGACVLVATAGAASADVACNREGDCWHVKESRHFTREHGIVVHPDNWRWAEHEREKFRWREHEGRGYWRDGAWIEIH